MTRQEELSFWLYGDGPRPSWVAADANKAYFANVVNHANGSLDDVINSPMLTDNAYWSAGRSANAAPSFSDAQAQLAAYVQGGPAPAWLGDLAADQRADVEAQRQVYSQQLPGYDFGDQPHTQYASEWSGAFLSGGVNRGVYGGDSNFGGFTFQGGPDPGLTPAGGGGAGGAGGTGTGTGGTGTGTAGQGGTADQRDALARIRTTLQQYGLPATLAEWAWEQILAGRSESEVVLDLYQRPEFQAALPEIAAVRAAGRTPPTPGEIIEFRQRAREIARAAGLPAGFYDNNDDFFRLIVGGVSLAEFGDRVSLARERAFNMPADVAAELDAISGRGHSFGDYTALAFDPDTALPILERMQREAQVQTAARRTGFGQLTETERTDLANSGYSFQQELAGFGQIARDSQLFNPLDTGEDVIGRSEQLGATFTGNAGAQQRIEGRRRRRTAQFESGGGFASSQGGVSGLAPAA